MGGKFTIKIFYAYSIKYTSKHHKIDILSIIKNLKKIEWGKKALTTCFLIIAYFLAHFVIEKAFYIGDGIKGNPFKFEKKGTGKKVIC